MISYAQNGEDVVLARAFDRPVGFYIDVGAASPVVNSVTKHFYDLGWRGVNVEPLELWHSQLVEQRPRDVNLLAGVAGVAGTLTFFDVSDAASEESTFSPEAAQALRARGLDPVTREVPVTTLRAICEEHVEGPIDFLKIDVEGYELPVVQGADWERFRPTIVVVESTEPGTGAPVADEVERFMSSVGYAPALFDGINRFYVQVEDSDLADRLRAPANVLDGFEPYGMVELRETVATLGQVLEREREDARMHLAALDARICELEEHGQAAQKRLEGLQARLDRTQEDLAVARHQANDADLQFRAAREALERALSEAR